MLAPFPFTLSRPTRLYRFMRTAAISAVLAVTPVLAAEPTPAKPAIMTDSTAPQLASEYLAYPGSLPSKVMAVQSAARVVLEVAVWTGMTRTFTVTVPDIDVPRTSADAPKCERDLAEKSIAFAQQFLGNTKHVLARDLRMHDTGGDVAKGAIITEAGSLADALKSKGFARSPDKSNTPWCTDK